MTASLSRIGHNDQMAVSVDTLRLPTFLDPEDRDLTMLQTEWPALHQRWKLRMRDCTDGDVAAPIAFADRRGNRFTKPVWQIVLHVVNQGTHHRGQVSGFLRAMGHTPPPLDLMEYYMTLR
jgi:uncharacterized damage-inducible protein DinB